MSRRKVLLDAGNTRLKWAVVSGRQWVEQGSADYVDLSELDRVLVKGDMCFVSSVVRGQHEAQITTLLATHGIMPQWLQSESIRRNVTNTYISPSQLGVDRWMGLIAARERSQTPTLVVSAGTALTADALSAEGLFLGGLIAPGMRLMRLALLQGADRVGDEPGTYQAFPRNTADAVQSGIESALCGAILQQYARLAELAQTAPLCILTGGDAAVVLPHLPFTVEQAPALVLEGMDLVTREDVAG